jgi:hypothetical protein
MAANARELSASAAAQSQRIAELNDELRDLRFALVARDAADANPDLRGAQIGGVIAKDKRRRARPK